MQMIDKIAKKVARPLITIGFCLVATMSLQGCVALIISSAPTGTFVAADRPAMGAQAEVNEIVLKGETGVSNVLGATTLGDVSSVN
jgi:hypothetical protein